MTKLEEEFGAELQKILDGKKTRSLDELKSKVDIIIHDWPDCELICLLYTSPSPRDRG